MCNNKIYLKVKDSFNPTGNVIGVYDYINCGKCEECISQRRNQWCWRAEQETNHCDNSLFITLTYDDDHLPLFGVNVKDIQLFFKRVRKYIATYLPNYNFKLKYFLCSEYGSKRKRPHYHAIIWNCPLSSDKLQQLWKNGFIYIGNCTPSSVQYTLKYFCIKQDYPEGMTKNFVLMSKGIGKQWLSENIYYDKPYVILKSVDKTSGKVYFSKIPLPRYFKETLVNYQSVLYPESNLKRFNYEWDYHPKLDRVFSKKFINTLDDNLKSQFNSMVNNDDFFYTEDNIKALRVISHMAYEFRQFRNRSFWKKYNKCNNRDNQ